MLGVMPDRSRSAVPFVDARTNAPEDALAGASIEVSSDGLAWPGLDVEAGVNGPWAVEDLSVKRHYLCLNTDATALRFEVGRRGGSELVEMPPGSLWFCPAGESFTHRVPTAAGFAVLTVEPDKLDQVVGDKRVRLQRKYAEVRPQLAHLVRALVAEAEHGGPSGAPFVGALGAAIALQIVEAFGERGAEIAAPAVGLPRARLRRVLELIDARLEEGVSVEEMAREAGLSPAHFARAFKQATGRAPHQALIARRLDRARAALETEDCGLLEIALRHGFTDQAHFTRLFRRHFGATPGEIARKRRGR
jgi:AraC family transcriptional regulator